MNLDEVIKSMERDTGIEKTASQNVPNAASQLTAALEKAAHVSRPSGSIPEGEVVGSLLKMANQLAGTEKDAELSHMALCGQAFADAAITRFATYEQMAQPYVKTASPEAVSDDVLVKTAAEIGYQEIMQKTAETASNQTHENELVKQSAEIGYNEVMHIAAQKNMEKTSEDELVKIAAETGYQETLEKAAADYQAGQDQALQEVHDLASAEFLKGAAETEIFLNNLRAQGHLA